MFLVGLWSDLLGGVQWREEAVPWDQPHERGGAAGGRRETGHAQQCCLHKEDVRIFEWLKKAGTNRIDANMSQSFKVCNDEDLLGA